MDTAINGAIDGDNLRKIVVDSLISGFVGAVAGDGGSELIKEGKNLILKSALSDFGNEMLYGSIENFSSWYANGIISTYDR